jgi:hypothetical protein
MMRRVVVFALVLWLGGSPAALAGETLLASASRLAREVARAEASSRTTSVVAPRNMFAAAQQGMPSVASSGMSRRKKAFIWLAAGVGFAATAYAIDHKVRDVTPSTLGTRQD